MSLVVFSVRRASVQNSGAALEVVRLVVGDVALLAVGVGVAVLQVRRVRPDVVVGRHAVELRVAVAAEAREDHHEEVDDAVLVGVVAVVVDLRVGDLGGVEDRLAGRAAGRVDVLQRADAGERADQRRALAVAAVVLRVARQLVPAVVDRGCRSCSRQPAAWPLVTPAHGGRVLREGEVRGVGPVGGRRASPTARSRAGTAGRRRSPGRG